MPKHQPVVSERKVDVEALDRLHHQNQQATREAVTPAKVDNQVDYLRRPQDGHVARTPTLRLSNPIPWYVQ